MFDKHTRYSFRHGLPRYTVSTPFFTMRYEKSEELSVAIVVSKKVSKKAVIRNKVKRQMMQLLEASNLKNMQYNMVIYMKQGVLTAYPADLAQTVRDTIKKIQ